MGGMYYHILWGSFLVAFVVALGVTPLAIRLAPKIGAIDIPGDNRRIHDRPIPRFGGLAIFAGVMVATIVFVVPNVFPEQMGWGIVVSGTIIYAFGVWDDIKEVSPKLKLLGQIVCAGTAFAFGIRVEFIGEFVGLEKMVFSDVASFIITIIWIVGIINAVNLIDGLDGLAAGIAAIASLCIAYVPYIHGQYLITAAMLAIAGGALGFLPYNFHPAKIFMGDSGSQFLGYCLATFALIGPTPVKGATIVAVLIPALVLGLPIFDTIFAIIRRIIRGKSVVSADKEHLHHRIMRAGFGQRRSVMLMYCISGIMGVVAVMYSREQYVECGGLLIIVVILLYILLSDTSTKKVGIHAVNIAREEGKQKRKRNEKKDMERNEHNDKQ